jgi:ABC-2 type transport system permease protein
MTSRILIPFHTSKQHYEYHITNNKREFIAKVRNKSFIVMTFLSPLLFVIAASCCRLFKFHESRYKANSIHDASGLFVRNFTAQNSKRRL